MFKLFQRLLNSRFWALAIKEVQQIFRDKKLLFMLVFPPTVQLLLYGLILNPDVQYLKMGVVDQVNVGASRELVAALTENDVFVADRYSASQQTLGEQVRRGDITLGVVFPPEFNRNLAQGKPAEIQVMVDGVDANTAGIASGYISQIVRQYSRQLEDAESFSMIQPQITFLYNPGLISSWFFVPAMMGVVLTLIGSLVSSSTLIREKDTGTLEQLLMTPASSSEILLAKVVPLFVLLLGDALLALSFANVVFSVPLRGSLLLFLAMSGLYVFVGIGIGMMLATLCRNQQQVILTSFFINMPLIQLSGAIAPIESMPAVFRYLSLLNPLRHYVAILRAVLLRGVGLEVIWPHAIALLVFATVLGTISTHQFRHQVS
ncbi:ABC transporter permease [Leptolyngbya cf. ectocarpi LEGE 11479]|uniref:Transport permease protein n=1 Tax=Leptolyngbya cf. ectocarpi LEGE 11479 TaxID=1828722 RepID=A0A928ZRY3_LEPEC|nr:ABC transporter permease [Leptolyngbya ectocarpi]MBE9067228.1 ABC transporter permease [Leptolyngbya cf. ectocarpi LEGE 11479]